MLSNSTLNKLRASLIRDEGYEKFPYMDSFGKIKIGIGYNLSDIGLSHDWINSQYLKDVSYFHDQLTNDFRWFNLLNEDRKVILINMCFMGYKKFLTFKKMLDALSFGDFHVAAHEILDSKWAIQDKNRAKRLALGMAIGTYNF